jgi:integrase
MIKNKLSNQEIVTIALYNLGGGIGSFDIESIAKEADKIAPGRFRWRTDPNMISDSNTWDALSNARKKKYILQQAQEKNTDSYLLTEEGIKFSKNNIKKIKSFDQGKIRIAVSKEIFDNTKARLQSSIAYKKVLENKINEISSREFNDFFRLNDYMKKNQKNEKIQKIKNLFISDKEFKKIIDLIAETQNGGKNNV